MAMPSRPFRPHRSLAAAAAASALLLFATACSDDGDSKDKLGAIKSPEAPAASSSDPAATSASGGKTLTKAQLEQAILGKDDVPAGVTVVPFQQSKDEAKAEKAACQAVIDVLSGGISVGKDSGYAANQYKIADDENAINVIMVATYKPGAAQKLMDDAVAALPGCASFTGKKGATTATYTAKKAAAESSADATLAIELSTSAPGLAKPVPTSYLIARVGDQLTMFVNVDTKELTSELPERKLVDQQVAKLKQAAK